MTMISTSTAAGYRAAATRTRRDRTSTATVAAANRAKATCALGIAAYGLCASRASPCSPEPIASPYPSPAIIRGGAVGTSTYPITASSWIATKVVRTREKAHGRASQTHARTPSVTGRCTPT